MRGHLIVYKDGLTRKDITLINYYLFGRIVNRKIAQNTVERYYYPGLFESTPYIKMTNGCYFTERIIDDFKGRLRIYPTEIIIPTDGFITAREHWKKFIQEKGYRVRNF